MALVAPVVDAGQTLLLIANEYAIEEILSTIAILIDELHGTVALGNLALRVAPEADALIHFTRARSCATSSVTKRASSAWLKSTR